MKYEVFGRGLHLGNFLFVKTPFFLPTWTNCISYELRFAQGQPTNPNNLLGPVGYIICRVNSVEEVSKKQQGYYK